MRRDIHLAQLFEDRIMGAWGFGVLSDDTGLDVYGDFMKLFNQKKSKQLILEEVTAKYADDPDDEDEYVVAQLAIAKALWDCGWLDSGTLRSIQSLIESGKGLEPWADEGPGVLARRKSALSKFLAKLQSPNPKPKKPKPPTQRKPVFLTGDCLSIKLEDGRYTAAVVLHHEELDPKRLKETYGASLVGLLNWIGANPPTPDVFEKRNWLHTTHHAWKGDRWIGSVHPTGFRAVKHRFEVVGKTMIRVKDPKTSNFWMNWGFPEQVVYQERWDKGIRDSNVEPR